jgi:hypothetical protein
LTPSLSTLLPVRNAQSSLESMLNQLLEILPELTPRWDVLVVENGSTDATVEVAHELARHYPQIQLAVNATPQTASQIMRSGLNLTTGDVILYRKEDSSASLFDIPKLWQQISRHDIVVSRSPAKSALGAIPRPAKGLDARKSRPEQALQLVRRRALEGWRLAPGQESMLDCLIRKGHRWTEVDVRAQSSISKKAPASLEALRALAEARLKSNRVDVATPVADGKTEVTRPNYLARLKSFALGE